MTEFTKKELEAVEKYKYLVDNYSDDMLVVTDNREDAKQYSLKVASGQYVYFEHDYKTGIIHEDYISFAELNSKDYEEARGTFDFDNNDYSEEEKRMLAIELFFENNMY